MDNVVPFFPSITQIISDDQINTRRISDLLNSAYIDHETEQDGALYVMDAVAFPLWLTVDHDTKLILMFTYIEPGNEVKFDWLDKVNTLNANIMLPQFSYRDGCMWGRYYLTYDGGLCVRHLIKMLRRFARAFRTAVEELDLVPQLRGPKQEIPGDSQ